MARIPHWIDNQSIEPYLVHIYRQLYLQPFAELVIAQLCILAGSDIFSNSVQLLFLIGCLSTFVAIASEFNFSKKAKIIGCLFLLYTPDILLQASSTQNDIVVSFFILSSILFAIKSYNEFNNSTLFLLSLSIALAFYTKGTAYIYLFPIVCLWGIFTLLKYKSLNLLIKMIIIPFMILLCNFGFYHRNYELSGDPLGKNEDRIFNEEHSPQQFFLNVSKNIGVHFAVYPFNQYANQAMEKFHLVFNEPIKNPATNFNGHGFKLKAWQHHEDDAASFFQILLVVFSVPFFLWHRKKYPKITWLFLLVPFVELLLLSAVLKWQPWITRLHVPLIFLLSFFVAQVMDQASGTSISKWLKTYLPFTVLVSYGCVILILNPTRPFITNSKTTEIKLTDTRTKKYVANYVNAEIDFYIARKYLKENKEAVGIDIGEDTWEYPLYYDIYSQHQNLAVPINVLNLSKTLEKKPKKELRYIISSKSDSLYLWEGKTYHLIRKMKILSIYKK